jgi:hypothetical protein
MNLGDHDPVVLFAMGKSSPKRDEIPLLWPPDFYQGGKTLGKTLFSCPPDSQESLNRGGISRLRITRTPRPPIPLLLYYFVTAKGNFNPWCSY